MFDKSPTFKIIDYICCMALVKFIFCLSTAMIGYKIHGSLFWSIINFFFAPISWIKWLICQEVNMTIIKETFSFISK